MWTVYMLRCADDTLYTGITNDLPRRLAAHNSGKGAKYTRPRRPVTLVYQEQTEDKGTALRREYAIKQLRREEKLALMKQEETTMREMRRKDRATTTQQAWEIVEACSYGILSLIDEEGLPYGVPVNCVREGEALYFHCAQEGKKTDALRKHERVAVTFVSASQVLEAQYTTDYASAMVFGVCREVTAAEEKKAALGRLCATWAPSNMEGFDQYCAAFLAETAVWKITPEAITGKRRK